MPIHVHSLNPVFDQIVRDVHAERMRQERLKAEGRFKFTCADEEMSMPEKLAVLGEEFGEACRAVLESKKLANDLHHGNLREELVQIAAVCLAWVEGMDKKTPVGV